MKGFLVCLLLGVSMMAMTDARPSRDMMRSDRMRMDQRMRMDERMRARPSFDEDEDEQDEDVFDAQMFEMLKDHMKMLQDQRAKADNQKSDEKAAKEEASEEKPVADEKPAVKPVADEKADQDTSEKSDELEEKQSKRDFLMQMLRNLRDHEDEEDEDDDDNEMDAREHMLRDLIARRNMMRMDSRARMDANRRPAPVADAPKPKADVKPKEDVQESKPKASQDEKADQLVKNLHDLLARMREEN